MSLPRAASARGASVLAALVFAGILTAMAGLIGGVSDQRIAISNESQTAMGGGSAATAKPAADGVEQKDCVPGTDYDVTFEDGKPSIKPYKPCDDLSATFPPSITPPRNTETYMFGTCPLVKRYIPFNPNKKWTCAVRECFTSPTISAGGAAPKKFCSYKEFNPNDKINAKEMRKNTITIAGSAMSDTEKAGALASARIPPTAIDTTTGNAITGAFDTEKQTDKDIQQAKVNAAYADYAASFKKLQDEECGPSSPISCKELTDKVNLQEKKVVEEQAKLDRLNADTIKESNASKVDGDLAAKQKEVDWAEDALQTCLEKHNNNAASCEQENKDVSDADDALCKAGDKAACNEINRNKNVPDPCDDAAYRQVHRAECSDAPPPGSRHRDRPDTGFGDEENCSQSDKARCAQNPMSSSCQKCAQGGNGAGQGDKNGGGGNKGGGNGQKPPQQPQQPQCQSQYRCEGNAIYNISPQTQCRPQLYQQCPGGYTCTGNSCVQSPNGTGTDGQSCQHPPAQPSPSTCTVGSWQPTREPNTCQNGWKCVRNPTPPPPSTPTNPPVVPPTPPQVSAQISCQPKTVEPGMPISISWSCTNATRSVGTGFSTGNILASSTSITAPLLGLGLSTTTNFGIACSDAQSQSVSAQCSIQTASPWITFITVPKSVQRGATATLGWITGGMSKCVVSSHDYANFTTQNAENTSPNGSVQTPSIDPSLSNVFWLTCTTVGGNVKEASSTITAL